ncbi:MAG: transcriptional repressor [Burkholderiaceae bacterium]
MSKVHDQARELVRRSGARVTSARIAVLAELLSAGAALTHQELRARLDRRRDDDEPDRVAGRAAGADSDSGGPPSAHALDRVTLYRVLDWLVDAGLAHRVPDPDRVMRFSAGGEGRAPDGHHGHFRCDVCQQVFCLADSPRLPDWVRQLLPPGFAAERMELTVSGRCARCA